MASASVKKVYAIKHQTGPDGRLRDLYTFHGARTGRPTGNGPQPTNLPKHGPNVVKCPACGRWHGAHSLWCMWCFTFTLRAPGGKEWNPDAMEDALAAISFRSLDYLESLFGDALKTVAGVLRGRFVAGPGKSVVSSDFTAIEGVVVACLAGEQWRIDAFAQDRSLYLESASRAFGLSIADMERHKAETGQHHPMRQVGKCMELGLGFGGWINALRQFDVDGTDDELKGYVLAWRAASRNIEWFWGGQKKGPADMIRGVPGADRWDRTPELFGLEGAAVNAVMNPGVEYPVARLDGKASGVSYLMHGDALYCRVPSGGLITYHRPRLMPAEKDWRGLEFTYEGWNSNQKYGPPGWMRMSCYSGKFCENVVQKVARDIQMNAIARCEDAGHEVVLHTYDEIVAEAECSVEELEALMTKPLPWTESWPIKAAGGWRGRRYRKA
jgi:DNA polymerase